MSSARAAGIPEEQLQNLSKLVSKSNQMEDAPLAGRKRAAPTNVLSETEEEDLEEEEGDAKELVDPEEGNPMERAVVQLTRIVDKLSKGKRQKEQRCRSFARWCRMRWSGGQLRERRKVQGCSVQEAEGLPVYRTIETLMEEDFHALRQAPGASSQATSWRAWLEHRSRVEHYPTTVRFCWILAGILDALQTGATAEARTRAALGLVAADQAALDNGSWLMAQEVLMEEPPL